MFNRMVLHSVSNQLLAIILNVIICKCIAMKYTNLLIINRHKLLINGIFFMPQTTSFKVKVHLDYLCIFTGPPSTHLVRSIIVKAFEATMDTKEDMTEFFFDLPSLAELLLMMARIWLLELLYHALVMAAIQVIISSLNPNPGYKQSFRDEYQ